MSGVSGLGGLSATPGSLNGAGGGSIQLGGALIWLAADKITGLADGEALTTWINTGTGANFTQAVAGNKPTYQTLEIGTLPIVRFDGNNDLLSAAAVMSLTQPCMIYWVAKRTGNTSAYNVGVTQTTETIAFGFNAGVNTWYTYSNPALVTQAASDNAFHLMICHYNAGSSTMYMDSLTGAAKVLDSGDITNGTFHVGATSGAAAALAGDIAEILVFSSAHTAAERTLVSNYLAAKWGITLS